jgi:hypothetical protein
MQILGSLNVFTLWHIVKMQNLIVQSMKPVIYHGPWDFVGINVIIEGQQHAVCIVFTGSEVVIGHIDTWQALE